jgi:ubiquinone/menaquinone biosynthesis C-methylase UbiE
MREWLRGRLRELRALAPGGRLIDIGSGSGLVTRCAEGLFERRVATDISQEILDANRDAFDVGVAADCDALPFPDGDFDVMTCFAVLHHLFAFDGLAAEAARVLKPGGIFYSDHDMDAAFYRRFRPLLALYRRMHNAAARYRKVSGEITDELYQLSEIQATGIDAAGFAALLEDRGFHVSLQFHWYGLTGVTDRIFGRRALRRGWAPLVRVTAVRQ